VIVIYCHFQAVFSAFEKGFQRFAVTANTLARKPFPLRSRPSMPLANRPGAAKSRRGPGRRSRLGWGPLLCRSGRYLKVSTGGAAWKGFTEEILTGFPCGEPRGSLVVDGQATHSPLAEKCAKTAFF